MNGTSVTTPDNGRKGYEGWIVPLLVALCVAVAAINVTWQAWDMFGPAHRPMLQGWDDSLYYVWLPSVVIDHSVDFSSQLLQHSDTTSEPALKAWLAEPRTATGLPPNKYPIGWALGSLPFFLAAHWLAPAGETGFGPTHLLAVWLGQLLYAAAGLVFATKIIRRMVPGAPAAVVVLTVWLASPLVYYQTVRVSMSHSQLFALAMAVYWLALRVSDGDKRRSIWFSLGFCAALMAVTRNISVVYLAFPALLLVRCLRAWREACWLVLGGVGPIAAQLVAWKFLYGSWVVYSYAGERFDFTALHLADVLFSARHGWFYWHPLLLIGILAFLYWMVPRSSGWAWAVSLGAIIVLNAAWPIWWFGSSFGNRAFEVATFFGMVGLAVLFDVTQRRPVWRRLLAGVAAGAVICNLLLLSLFLTGRVSREYAVTYADAALALVNWWAGSN